MTHQTYVQAIRRSLTGPEEEGSMRVFGAAEELLMWAEVSGEVEMHAPNWHTLELQVPGQRFSIEVPLAGAVLRNLVARLSSLADDGRNAPLLRDGHATLRRTATQLNLALTNRPGAPGIRISRT